VPLPYILRMTQPGSPAPYSTPQTSGKATGALVCGILGLVVCGPLGIVAIILARQAEDEIAASGGRLGGDSQARVGRILGWIAVALMVIGLVVLVLLLALNGDSDSSGY
jgi:Domain of unknown function (DUF4190)